MWDRAIPSPLSFCQFRLQITRESDSRSVHLRTVVTAVWHCAQRSCSAVSIPTTCCITGSCHLQNGSLRDSTSRPLQEDSSPLEKRSFHTMCWHCLLRATAFLGAVALRSLVLHKSSGWAHLWLQLEALTTTKTPPFSTPIISDPSSVFFFSPWKSCKIQCKKLLAELHHEITLCLYS